MTSNYEDFDYSEWLEESPTATPDVESIQLLTLNSMDKNELRKVFTSADKDPHFFPPVTVAASKETVADLHALGDLLSKMEHETKRCLVLGRLKDDVSGAFKRKGAFLPQPSRLLILDFDESPHATVDGLIETLPESLRTTDCAACLTARHGHGGKSHYRLFYLADRELTFDEQRRIAAGVGADKSIYEPGRLIFTAAPGGRYAPHVEAPRVTLYQGGNDREIVDAAALLECLPEPVEERRDTRADGPSTDRFLLSADELKLMLERLSVTEYGDRADWLRVAAASFHSAIDTDEAFVVFDDWSAGDPEFETDDRRPTWDSLSRSSGNRLGFFFLAREVEKHGGQVPREIKERIRTRYPRSELGNARRFLDKFGEDFIYVPGIGWRYWDGRRWKEDKEGLSARRHVAALGADIREEARHIEDGDEAKRHFSWAVSTERAAMVNNVLKLCEPQACIDVGQLDCDLYALNCLNGTVDLQTGEIHEHRREDWITKLAPVEYLPDAHAPKWERFLKQCLPSKAVRGFLQKAMGYATTGDVSEQVVFFNHGTGANGKGTFLRAMLEALGDYANASPPGLLMESRSERHPTELASLLGARFVSCQETGEDQAFNEERLKWLTGDDLIKARFMHRDFIEFKPTHKFVVASNYRPRIRGTDYAIWRRIILVPWDVRFEGDAKDPQLTSKLLDELPGICRWIVDGAVRWSRERLKPPTEVRAAVRDYQQSEDTVARWVAERTVADNSSQTKASELYSDFINFCRDTGERGRVSQTAFGRRLSEMGFMKVPDKRYVVRAGIRLKKMFEDNDYADYTDYTAEVAAEILN